MERNRMITKTKAVVMFFLLLIGSMGAVCQELGGGAREEVEKLAIQYYEEGKLQESYDSSPRWRRRSGRSRAGCSVRRG